MVWNEIPDLTTLQISKRSNSRFFTFLKDPVFIVQYCLDLEKQSKTVFPRPLVLFRFGEAIENSLPRPLYCLDLEKQSKTVFPRPLLSYCY